MLKWGDRKIREEKKYQNFSKFDENCKLTDIRIPSTPTIIKLLQGTSTAATKLRHLLLGRKAMTNLDRLLKSRDIILPTKVCVVKAMVFPVVIYACESWTIKKAEQWRIDAFQWWYWRRLLRVPLTSRRSNQSILKEINPGYDFMTKQWQQ